MKIGVVVASENAMPNAFAVFRGLQNGMEQAARLGYDGVELAVRDGREFSAADIRRQAEGFGLQVCAISTGQVFAAQNLWLSARNGEIRRAAVSAFLDIIDMASQLGCPVNIGRARGFIEENDSEQDTTLRFADSLKILTEYAKERGVCLVLEPINRYETNYINSLEEAAALAAHLEKLGIHGLRLMPDLFHMNIEDADMDASLKRHAGRIGYLHAADSNRLAPGWGHQPFTRIFQTLAEIGYDGWLTAEILPLPSAGEAARQAATFLREFFPPQARPAKKERCKR
jgi:sugar phosphate isomerase/epimerase